MGRKLLDASTIGDAFHDFRPRPDRDRGGFIPIRLRQKQWSTATTEEATLLEVRPVE